MQCTWVILSGGSRPAPLTRLLSSILAYAPDPKEVIVVGVPPKNAFAGTRSLEFVNLAREGRLSALRNRAAEMAQGEVLAFLDDDLELAPDWFGRTCNLMDGLRSGQLDIGTTRVLGANGRRWYDWCWASRIDHAAPVMLLPYRKNDSPNLFVSGCCMLMSKKAWAKVRFDEGLVYYQREDVDFCHRARDARLRFKCEWRAEAIHLLEPSGRDSTNPGLAQVIFLYRKGQLAEASQKLREIGPGLPNRQRDYYEGLFHFLAGRLDRAKVSFARLLEPAESGSILDFHQIQGLYRLGLAEMKSSRREAAERLFLHVLENMPDHPFARFRLRRLSSTPTKTDVHPADDEAISATASPICPPTSRGESVS